MVRERNPRWEVKHMMPAPTYTFMAAYVDTVTNLGVRGVAPVTARLRPACG